MTHEIGDQLESSLANLTQWDGGATALWRSALKMAHVKRRAGRSILERLGAWRPSAAVVGSLLFGCLFIISAIINLPPLFSPAARDRSRTVNPALIAQNRAKMLMSLGEPQYGYQQQNGAGTPASIVGTSSSVLDSEKWASVRGHTPEGSESYTLTRVLGEPRPESAKAESIPRQVIRKATIELVPTEVRTAFLKAQHVVRAADGEYVESSSLLGSGASAYAQLVLRVASARLGEVLNELRQHGEVTSENQEGQDVTGAVVDVEARLRNERKVEMEVLQLLESRKDAPLKDVLELREKLSQLRGEIERLTGQRDSYTRLVSLSTVIVILYGTNASVMRQDGLGGYLGDSIGRAWESGLRFLVDTLATMLKITVGGLVWWILLGGGAVAILRARRSARG